MNYKNFVQLYSCTVLPVPVQIPEYMYNESIAESECIATVKHRTYSENHYKFFPPLRIRTFGLLLLRIHTNVWNRLRITTFTSPPYQFPHFFRAPFQFGTFAQHRHDIKTFPSPPTRDQMTDNNRHEFTTSVTLPS